MSAHTKGRLALFSVADCLQLDRFGKLPGSTEACVVHWSGFDASPIPLPESVANARRLVACWNACIGITTESLELVPDLKAVGIKSIETVERANAGLVEALREIASDANELKRNDCADKGERKAWAAIEAKALAATQKVPS